MKTAIVFVFILLTSLDGAPVWVEASRVEVIRGSQSECKFGNGAAIRIAGRGLCVKETPDEIRALIRDAK